MAEAMVVEFSSFTPMPLEVILQKQIQATKELLIALGSVEVSPLVLLACLFCIPQRGIYLGISRSHVFPSEYRCLPAMRLRDFLLSSHASI